MFLIFVFYILISFNSVLIIVESIYTFFLILDPYTLQMIS